jgi:hypothetical protein
VRIAGSDYDNRTYTAPNGIELLVPGGYPVGASAARIQANPSLLVEARNAASLDGHDVSFAAQRLAGTPLLGTGDQLLAEIHRYLGRFVAYPSPHAQVAHALWIVHAHLMEAWESTPRLAFLSPEPGSGKSRALEVMELLVPRAVEAVNATPAYLFRRVSAEGGPPTILFDEIDTIFGPKARENEEIRGMLNAGHRRHSVSGRCVVRGKKVFTEELPAYCAVALAGLGHLPETILRRSIVIRMRRRAPNERIEPYRRRVTKAEGDDLHARLADWAATKLEDLSQARPEMPAGIEDRNADVWEALLAVADAAGGEWPGMARSAAVAFVTQAQETSPSVGVLLLRDLQALFNGRSAMTTVEIIEGLCALTESPWSDFKGKPLDARTLSRLLAPYEIAAKTIRVAGGTPRAYRREDMLDAWQRYLSPQGQKSETSET